MKAAVLQQAGTIPVYGEFPDPVLNDDNSIIIKVKASSIKNIDKGRASGAHYDSYKSLPAVVGVDGVGEMENGQRVFTLFSDGMMAEKAIVQKNKYIPVPDNLDDVTAAAIPNPGLSAWFSLAYRAGIQKGDTVFILGATGVTGKMAIQLAKYFGAGKIIAAGRNPEVLKTLPALGADQLVSLAQPEEDLIKELKSIIKQSPIDIVIDYTWGRPAEILLGTLAGHDLQADAHRTRYVSVGSMAGESIQLPSAVLRSTAIELYGVGGGSISKEVMRNVTTEILPKLFQLAADGVVKIDTQVVQLKDIHEAWQIKEAGTRLVVVP